MVTQKKHWFQQNTSRTAHSREMRQHSLIGSEFGVNNVKACSAWYNGSGCYYWSYFPGKLWTPYWHSPLLLTLIITLWPQWTFWWLPSGGSTKFGGIHESSLSSRAYLGCSGRGAPDHTRCDAVNSSAAAAWWSHVSKSKSDKIILLVMKAKEGPPSPCYSN